MEEEKEYKTSRRFWLKFNQHYFNEDKIIYLESMENGHKYIYVWIKMLLLCLKDDESNAGFLRFNNKIPYKDELLSKILHVDIDTIRVSMKYFTELEMVEILEDGTIYIEEIQRLIGSESTSAERVRKHRERKLLQSNKSNSYKKRNKRRSKEEEEKRREDIKEIVTYLNNKLNTSFKDTSKKTIDSIIARFNDKYTIQDFKNVIDIKTKQWLNDKKMDSFLRPSTLFGNKFENYLQEYNRNNKPIQNKVNSEKPDSLDGMEIKYD